MPIELDEMGVMLDGQTYIPFQHVVTVHHSCGEIGVTTVEDTYSSITPEDSLISLKVAMREYWRRAHGNH